MTETPANKNTDDIFGYLSVSAAKSKARDLLSPADRTSLTVKRLRDEEAEANSEKNARLRAFRSQRVKKPRK